ncbi:MAG: ABC transporter ATP-binding protein [Anaerolineae bacterium]
MNEFWRFLDYVRPYRWHVVVAGICLVIVAGLRLVLPWAVQRLVDVVFARGDATFLNQLALFLLSLIVVQTFFNVGQTYLLSYVGEGVVADLRISLYRKLQTLDLRFFADRRVGEIMSRVTNDVTTIQSVVTSQLTSFFTQLLTFIGALALITYTSTRLTALMLLIIPPVVLIARFFGTRLRGMSTTVQDRLADTTAVLEETLGGVRVVKSFAREPHEIRRFTDAVEETLSAALTRARYRAGFTPIITFSGFGGLTFVLWYGGRLVLADQLTPGELISFLFYTFMIAGSVAVFSGIYGQIQESLGALRRVFELLDTEPAVVDKPDAVAMPPIKGRVRFEDISFAYDEGLVLRNVDLDVAPGEIIALVGPSGAGKTTLVNLIPRFYETAAGQITIDGVDIRDVRLPSLREQIGIVPQETLLFSTTVRENILYGRLDATEDELTTAAKAANAHEFITDLPEGYDTRVGERGVKLSGGQRQRVAIARALLKNPRILLLDEATSSLDSESEGLVQEALSRLMQGRTTFIIAHRLATVQIADRIAVLDKGRIVELGTHEELLARGGLYAHLYALQFRALDGGVEPTELAEADVGQAMPETRRREMDLSPLLRFD